MSDRPVRSRRVTKTTAKKAVKKAAKKSPQSGPHRSSGRPRRRQRRSRRRRRRRPRAQTRDAPRQSRYRRECGRTGEAAIRKAVGLKSGATTPVATTSASSKPIEVSVGTDAAFAPTTGKPRRTLKNISEVRHFFRTNDVPILFFGATPFNLLGLDRWVRNFTYITYYDAWDGAHPRVFTPSEKPYQEFDSGEEINNWLLTNPEVRAHIDSVTPRGVRPKVAMVFFDSETEEICKELGYDLILPAASLRTAPRLQDRHHAAGQRGRRAERAERADPRRRLGRVFRRRPKRPVSVTNSSSRRRTATPGRPPSSSPRRPTGRSTARTSSAKRSR